MASYSEEQRKLVQEYVKKLRSVKSTIGRSSLMSLDLQSAKRREDVTETKHGTPLHSSDSERSFDSSSSEWCSDYLTCRESLSSSEEEGTTTVNSTLTKKLAAVTSQGQRSSISTCTETVSNLEEAKNTKVKLSPPKNLADVCPKPLRNIVNPVPPVLQGDNLTSVAREFVAHFAHPHFERNLVGELYICPTCYKAVATLESVRKLVCQQPQGRQTILNNTNFMQVLLKLCYVDSEELPRICTVNSEEMKRFYQSGKDQSLWGKVTFVQDDIESKKYWEQLVGPAARSIKTSTYLLMDKHNKAAPKDLGSWPEGRNKESPHELFRNEKAAVNAAEVVCRAEHLTVTGCIDAGHLWVYCGKEEKGKASFLTEMLSKQLLPLIKTELQPSVGDLVAVAATDGCTKRALILAVQNDTAHVWALDFAEFLKVPWRELMDLPMSFHCLPPAVSLCVVKYVRGAPYLNLLRECLQTLKCITFHQNRNVHTLLANKLSQLKGFEVLASLVSCIDREIRCRAIVVLLQMCRRKIGRQEASKAGCTEKAFVQLKKLLRRPREQECNDNCWAIIEEKQHLVNLLQHLFFRNEELLLDWADSDMMETLVKVQQMSSPGSPLHRDVDNCLRAFLGSLYLECRPPSDIKLVSMTPEKLRMTQGSQQSSHKSALQPIPTENGLKNNVPVPTQAQIGFPNTSRRQCYLQGTIVNFGTDENHELRPITNMKFASARTLSKIMCSLLNTWSPSAIYYGITQDCYVRGVFLSQEQRDALRRGIDFMAGNIRPHLTTCGFSVNFVPVMKKSEEIMSGVSINLHVVEILVLGVVNTVYTMSDGMCFLRSGPTTYQAKTHEVRQWIASQEEQHWLKGSMLKGASDPADNVSVAS